MNTNENESVRNDTQEDVIELGVASVETLGGGGPRIEPLGFLPPAGLAED